MSNLLPLKREDTAFLLQMETLPEGKVNPKHKISWALERRETKWLCIVSNSVCLSKLIFSSWNLPKPFSLFFVEDVVQLLDLYQRDES